MQSDPTNRQTAPESETTEPRFLLGIDTCGPCGSVALGRLVGGQFELVEQIELEGRSYSAKLVASVGDLLGRVGVKVRDLAAIVAVTGPGSFTGVRIGLSAAKGLAEVASTPVVAVSRLEVLAAKADTQFAALDAHRREMFLRCGNADDTPKEVLVGEDELRAMAQALDGKIAVCDEAAAALLRSIWPTAQLVRTAAPTAADALRVCWSRVEAGEFADPVLLDGHYLRRSDAEIFGDVVKAHGA